MDDLPHLVRDVRRKWLVLVGDAEGLLAASAALAGFLFPARPGTQTEFYLWLVIGLLG